MTISWDSVECIHRNGLITHYIISYGPIDDNSLATIETVNNNEPDDGGRFTATEILSTKSYVFKVAAVNAAGVGVFATVSKNYADENQSSNNTTNTAAGLTAVIMMLLLALVICGVIIAIQ